MQIVENVLKQWKELFEKGEFKRDEWKFYFEQIVGSFAKEGMPDDFQEFLMNQIKKENGADDGPGTAEELIHGMR